MGWVSWPWAVVGRADLQEGTAEGKGWRSPNCIASVRQQPLCAVRVPEVPKGGNCTGTPFMEIIPAGHGYPRGLGGFAVAGRGGGGPAEGSGQG